MRIAVLGPLAPIRGGIAAHTEGAIAALRACGHEVEAVAYSRLYPRWVPGMTPAVGMRPGAGTRCVSKGNEIVVDCFAPRTWLRAAARLGALSPDVVVAQYWTPAAAPAIAAVLSRVEMAKRILVCHNIDPHEWIPGASALARGVFRRCDGVIFHSRYVREKALALGCSMPAAVAPIPLLLGGSAVGERAPPELATPRANGARLFVCPGHVRKYKGLGVVAAAWRRVAPPDDALLVVAGEWLAARSEVRTLRRMGAKVLFIPRYLDDEELTWMLSHAEAVLLPYVTASQSGVLPVALRLARHVVVSDAGGLLEDVQAAEGARSSVTAVAAGEVAALAAAIAGLITRGSGRGSGPGNGASRHVAASISATERRESWMPFVSALQGLVSEVGPSPVSNSAGLGSSDLLWKFPTVSRPSARGTMRGARRAE